MNPHNRLHAALDDLARSVIPDEANLGPHLAGSVQASARPARLRPAWSAALALLLVALLATAVYAAFRAFRDPGLQSAAQAGLIPTRAQTAEPTVFATQPSLPGSQETLDGVTVSLDWAYADENRLALQLSVSGLQVPPGAFPGQLVCRPYVSSDEHVSVGTLFTAPLLEGDIGQGQPGDPLVLTYLNELHLEAGRFQTLHLNLDLTIGDCRPVWNYQETNLPTPTAPYPLIGNYHLRFEVPVQKGVTLSPGQTVTVNGIAVTLESVRLSRSWTSARICFTPPKTSAFPANKDWWLGQVTIRQDGGEPLSLGGSAEFVDRYGGSCGDWGAPAPNLQEPKRVSVQVGAVYSASTMGLPDSEQQAAARQKLAAQGIEVSFEQAEDGRWWKLLKTPAGMGIDEANRKVEEALTKEFDGPWVFEVPVKP